MDSILGLGIGISGLVASIVVSGMYWRRAQLLRKLPLYYCSFLGIIYFWVGTDERNWASTLEILAGFALVGPIVYFAVWIECREKGDRFF